MLEHISKYDNNFKSRNLAFDLIDNKEDFKFIFTSILIIL